MNIDQFLQTMGENPGVSIQVLLPEGHPVPPHFHVTEVGLVRKDFVDCGGTVRSTTACVIQIWVASDLDHRIDTTKLSRIFELAAPVLKTTSLPIEIEYDWGTISQYPLDSVETTPSGIVMQLGSKHTACLAPELCLPVADQPCCGPAGCC